ncbi:MAG: glycosyltransferase family 4 protein [Alistipes sp.]|nr:glycosyltransferase family 4 protein [Alistipes sp.]
MKIAMLGHKYIPSREGGIEVVVEELCVRMSSLGHNIVCYNRKNPKISSEKTNNYKGIKIKEVFTINRRGLAAVTSSVFGSIGAAFGRYDVVHIHAEGPAFMCWLPKLFGKKVIVTIHGLDHQRAKWGKFASWYIRSGEKNAVRFADEIIVLSKGVQDYFKETYHRNTKFIPNGVNRKERRTADMIADKWNLKENDYILYLGRIVPEKGIHYLIQAFQNLKTDKKLVIAGGSSDTDKYMAELRNMAKNDSRIIFTGFVEGRLKHELYSNAYIYTLPSDLEGMPLSLLEAMSYGCCCLTSDIAECAEVVENKAVTFRKGSVADLKAKLQMLCDSPETAKKYRDEAADFICEKYKWDDVVEKTLRLYV